MRYSLYKASDWIESHNVPFIYSHALNRQLSHVSHCHDFYEIIYLFSGKAKHSINGYFYDMSSGDIAFLRPFEQHCFYEQSDEIELFSISVTVNELESLLKAYHLLSECSNSKERICFTLDPSVRHMLYSSFKQLDRINNHQREHMIRIILGSTIHEYIKFLSDESFEWIDKIMIQMRKQSNLQEGIAAFLRISNLSHAQLCRVVKKRIGKTPNQFIKELRLNHAYDLIISTNLSFEEISFLVGYNSFSHFATSFKSRYGLTPSALRKNNNNLL